MKIEKIITFCIIGIIVITIALVTVTFFQQGENAIDTCKEEGFDGAKFPELFNMYYKCCKDVENQYGGVNEICTRLREE